MQMMQMMQAWRGGQFAAKYFASVKEEHDRRVHERAIKLIGEWRNNASTDEENNWIDRKIADMDAFVEEQREKLEVLMEQETLMDVDTGYKKRSIDQTDDPDL